GTFGLAAEWQLAASRRSRRSRSQSRIWCERSDRSIWLDGKRIVGELEEDLFGYLQVLAASYPNPIAYGKIEAQVPTLPEKQSRLNTKVDALPRAFSKVFEIERTSGRGHLLKIREQEN